MEWYRREISKCTYRKFTTGFYFGKPNESAQVYDNSTYVNEYVYLGTVEETDRRGFAKFEQRNKFSVGDTIEIMKPDGTNINAKVLAMYDEQGNEVPSCPHSKQILFAELSESAAKNDIMRAPVKTSSIQYTWV